MISRLRVPLADMNSADAQLHGEIREGFFPDQVFQIFPVLSGRGLLPDDLFRDIQNPLLREV